MKPSDLETFIHRKLAELPVPKAPGTLLPRIMAEAGRTRRSPRRERAWIGGIRRQPAVRLAAATALILMGVLAVDWSLGGRVGSLWSGLMATAEEAAAGTATMVLEARILWRVFLEPVAAYLVLWVGVMWVVLALLWEALRSMLWERSIG